MQNSSTNHRMDGLVLDNSYSRLPPRFYQKLAPAKVTAPKIISFNESLASDLGIDLESLTALERAEIFSGNTIPNTSQPLAMVYAGHQFGSFVPQLGDGRAILLGEVKDARSTLHDIQLKGAGRTLYSRQGDGRSALGPVLREYLVSESMHALGVPTTRALAAVMTGEKVYRETALPGAILTRVAASHIRIGTFQYFSARGDNEAIQILADYVIERHYPEIKDSDQPYIELLRRVEEQQAKLIAQWMHCGFIHGVMNTDNMTISGETIDFGPCAFMDSYDPSTVFSSIDHLGRYAYSNQPGIGQWNLARFAETLLHLINENLDHAVSVATEIVNEFPKQFENYWLKGMRKKIGLMTEESDDRNLIQSLLELMHKEKLDFTLTFRGLSNLISPADLHPEQKADLSTVSVSLEKWASKWRNRLARENAHTTDLAHNMQQVNPLCIPRNHQVEHALQRAAQHNDFNPFYRLHQALTNPYLETTLTLEYSKPPKPEQCVLETFCGT